MSEESIQNNRFENLSEEAKAEVPARTSPEEHSEQTRPACRSTTWTSSQEAGVVAKGSCREGISATTDRMTKGQVIGDKGTGHLPHRA